MAKKDEKDEKNGKNAGAAAGQAPRRGSGQAAVEVEDQRREATEGARGGPLGETRDAQVTGPGGEPAVRIRVDEREMSSSYANAFRTNGTDEEVILDFGLNLMNPAARGEGVQGSPRGSGLAPRQGSGLAGEIIFRVTDRVIMKSGT